MQEQTEQQNYSLTIVLETHPNQGQDANLWLSYGGSLLMAVFDGMGGRSGLIGDEQGARIASHSARQSAVSFFKELEKKGKKLDKTNCIGLQQLIQQDLKRIKNEADKNAVKKSRVKGFKDTLQKDKLATTLALVSISLSQDSSDIIDLDLAWMGDSRIYFLSSQKGLQQLTKDDLAEYKDAFHSVLEAGSPMSQYLTPDMGADGTINFKCVQIKDPGLVIACTDGAFDGLYPWQVEYIILYYLNKSNNLKEWEEELIQYYDKRKVGDDVTLLLFIVGFDNNNFNSLKKSYNNNRYQQLCKFWEDSESKNQENIRQIWNTYRPNYEERISQFQYSSLTNSPEPVINPDVTQKLSNFKLGSGSAKRVENSSENINKTPNSIDADLNPLEILSNVLPQDQSNQNQTNQCLSQDPSVNTNNNDIPHKPNINSTNRVRTTTNPNIQVGKNTNQLENNENHTVFLSFIENLLNQEKYNEAIPALDTIIEQNSDYIPALSYLILAYIKKENKGIQLPRISSNEDSKNSYGKSNEIFKKICASIKEKKLLENADQSTLFSLEKLIESFSKLEITDFDKINLDEAGVEFIKQICSKLDKFENYKNPYLSELKGKILDFERKNDQSLSPAESKKKMDDVKKYWEEACKLYDEKGNKKRSDECKKQLNRLKPWWNRTIFWILIK